MKKFVAVGFVAVLVISAYLVGKEHKGIPSSTLPLSQNGSNVDSEGICTRTEPYAMEPEFSRALSIIKQRFINNSDLVDKEIINCLDISYKQLDFGTLGLFTFDPNNSNPNHLTIYVDNSYQAKDDLLTAYLLIHEITHASNYVRRLQEVANFDCYTDEATAFYNQFAFINFLNEGEKDSILTRTYLSDSPDPSLAEVEFSYNLAYAAADKCGGNTEDECFTNNFLAGLLQRVKSDPAYQEQCSY